MTLFLLGKYALEMKFLFRVLHSKYWNYIFNFLSSLCILDLQNAESVVFTQGLTDHIVTVTTQPADGEAESLEMTNDILGAEGMGQTTP